MKRNTYQFDLDPRVRVQLTERQAHLLNNLKVWKSYGGYVTNYNKSEMAEYAVAAGILEEALDECHVKCPDDGVGRILSLV